MPTENNPTSCQWSSISVSKCTDVSPSVEGLVETAWVRLKVADACLLSRGLEGRNRNLKHTEQSPLYKTTQEKNPVTSFENIVINCDGCQIYGLLCLSTAMKALHKQTEGTAAER